VAIDVIVAGFFMGDRMAGMSNQNDMNVELVQIDIHERPISVLTNWLGLIEVAAIVTLVVVGLAVLFAAVLQKKNRPTH